MDTQVFLKGRIAGTPQSMPWQPGPLPEMVTWQRRLRARVRKLIGGCSDPRTPLNARVTETREFARYRRETVLFESRPGFEVFAYLLIPRDHTKRAPAVLCLPGHGRGVDSIVGIGPDGRVRELGEPSDYSKDFGLQCVAQGYVTLAVEQMSFGHRRDAQAREAGPEASSCNRDATSLLMLGDTMTGWRVWDAMRSIDYLRTRPEVDPKRIATMGISGGGLTSLFTACVDTRVRAAVVSGYLNTFRDCVLAVDHCVDNYIPGLQTVVEMPDMAGLVAPRALFAEGGSTDPIFPRPAFLQATARLEAIYAAFGAPAQFGWEAFEGEHEFHGAGAFRFLAARL